MWRQEGEKRRPHARTGGRARRSLPAPDSRALALPPAHTHHLTTTPSHSQQLAALAAARAGLPGAAPLAPSTPSRPRPPPTNDAAALADKLEDVAWPEGAAWAEGRALTSARVEEVASVDDDLDRETAFYHQAAAAVTAALTSYERAGVAWARPHDFYAEMVKSDGHMARVKAQLVYEKTSADAADERRKARTAKQYSKEVAAERRKDKVAAKKAASAGVAKLRADRKRSGYAGHLDADAALKALESGKGVHTLGGRAMAGAPAVSKKKAAKDARYGFGGRKAGKRNNDAYSAADVSDWKKPARGGDAGLKGRGGGGGGKKGGVKRPGKARRAAMKK